MKNLIIFDTVIGTSNLGDDIIYKSLEEQIMPLLDNSFVVKYATHLNNYTLYQYIRMRYRRRYIANSDYKLIMGTNLLSYDLFKSRHQWMVNLRNAGMYRDVIMAGVGTTQEKRNVTLYSKMLYKKILNKNFIHSVRDEESADFMRSLGVKVLNTGCPTLWKLTPEFCAEIPREKSRNVVFSVSGYYAQRNVEQDQKMIEILEKNYDKLYFWNQTVADEEYLKTLHTTKKYETISSLHAYSEVLNKGDVDYIGTRLHGGVYALQHKVRAIVVSIDQRARGFHESNNLNIIERNEIEKLPDMINQELETRIILNEDNIKKWKAQFGI